LDTEINTSQLSIEGLRETSYLFHCIPSSQPKKKKKIVHCIPTCENEISLFFCHFWSWGIPPITMAAPLHYDYFYLVQQCPESFYNTGKVTCLPNKIKPYFTIHGFWA